MDFTNVSLRDTCGIEKGSPKEHSKLKNATWDCFNSGEEDHLVVDWMKDHKLQVNNVEVSLDDEENFLRMIHYTMRKNDNIHETLLQSLLDTGSAVSFVKMQHVPDSFIKIESNPLSQFRGINSSSLVVLGTVYTDVELDGQLWHNVRLLVVPDSTMVPPVIIGKDILKLFKMRLVADRSGHSRSRRGCCNNEHQYGEAQCRRSGFVEGEL